MKPDKPGWWWWRGEPNAEPKILSVHQGATELWVRDEVDLIEIPISKLHGEFICPCYKPGESFTLTEIFYWILKQARIFHTPNWANCCESLSRRICDLQDGIKAFINMNQG